MKYYIIKNQEMPWGDYGNMLFSGLLNVMDEDYNDLDVPELERTGPYIPDIYIANRHNIVVVEFVRNLIEKSEISGIKGFRYVLKKKIVNINWQTWDKNKKDPFFYPKSKEPEDYILKGKNDNQLANLMPKVWELDIIQKYELEKIKDEPDNIAYSDLALKDTPELDIFYPKNMLFVVVSEKFKSLLISNEIKSLNFIELKKIDRSSASNQVI